MESLEPTMDLFGDAFVARSSSVRRGSCPPEVLPADVDFAVHALASALPQRLYLGTSSWSFPGWNKLLWRGEYDQAMLSRHGLPAYSQHPMLRTVSLDRAFYRPLSTSQYAAYAAQVPEHFRFLVKAPSLVTDALIRSDDGRGRQPNEAFLNARLAADEFFRPVVDGLAAKAGALVFQFSPLPRCWMQRLPEFLDRLEKMLTTLPRIWPTAPDAVVAVEVRDRELLTPRFVQILKTTGVTYCLGLHAKMPPIEDQLPLLRALWPGPLVCRWNLHRKHGAFGYDNAKTRYEPFNALVDPDPVTRDVLAKIIVGTTGAGFAAHVTINNKAEGSAPLSVIELAKAVAVRLAVSPP